MLRQQDIGIIGMAVMGRNLALNIARHGYRVSIFNRSPEKTEKVIIDNPGKKIFPYFSIKEFVCSLKCPRRILLMVKAGVSTDQVINFIISFLEKGDILIDGGNAFYKDTIRRNHNLSKNGFNFIGLGVSGGEEGALHGPSLMLSGQKDIYLLIAPIFKKIAACVENEACVTYIGPDGSGHYVKMIHNGIEYADMQLIAEAYMLLKNTLNLNNDQLANIFSEWNEGELNSYLIDITKNILIKKDNEGKHLIDFILDEAETKGTGKWTSQNALDLGEPLSVITESVFFRYLSSLKKERIKASKILLGPGEHKICVDKRVFIENVRKSLYFSKIIAYAQGFSQLQTMSNKNEWNLNYGKIAKIFRAGCIIRAQFLKRIIDAYVEDEYITNLLLSPYFKMIADKYQQALRDTVSYVVRQGMPIPGFSAAIAYYDSYRSAFLPTNLIQAQRDYFGSHGYKRIDKEGIFHTRWME